MKKVLIGAVAVLMLFPFQDNQANATQIDGVLGNKHQAFQVIGDWLGCGNGQKHLWCKK